MSATQHHAIAYAALGFKILALGAKSKRPHNELAPRGMYSATDDWETILTWFEKDPDINIGIHCKASNLVVLDVDTRNGGTTDGLPATRRIKTGNGFHYYYRCNPEMTFPGKWREGIDIKFNGYVVAAPSIHPNGHVYAVDDPMEIKPVEELVGAR